MPLKLVFALFIAYILNFKIACVNVFRTVYYIPSILGGSVAIAVLWKAVFRDDGLVNTLIRMLTFGHFQGPSWLSDPATHCGSSASCVSGSSAPPWCCSSPL